MTARQSFHLAGERNARQTRQEPVQRRGHTGSRQASSCPPGYFCSSLTEVTPALNTTFGIGAKSSPAPNA